MGAQVIDGRALAQQMRRLIAERVARLRSAGVSVRLDAVLASGPDTSARVYAESQGRTCEELGIEYRLHELPASGKGSAFDDVAGRVLLLNTDENVSAIMVHLPLPEGVDPHAVQALIDPRKDVEGVNPANIGNVVYGRLSLVPCTALATLKMIESTGVELRGRLAVVVGAGDVVGKPIAVLLMRHEATVISCNEYTPDTPALTRGADVVVAAAGVPGLVTAGMVKPGAVVVDVGVTTVVDAEGRRRTVGDVAFDEVREVAGWISPVPGGVGPMTVATLLHNVTSAAERRLRPAGAV